MCIEIADVVSKIQSIFICWTREQSMKVHRDLWYENIDLPLLVIEIGTFSKKLYGTAILTTGDLTQMWRSDGKCLYIPSYGS